MSGHTYTHTHTHTYIHTDNYYNPRCAHVHRGLIMFVRFRETHLVGLDFFSNARLCSSEGFYSLLMI